MTNESYAYVWGAVAAFLTLVLLYTIAFNHGKNYAERKAVRKYSMTGIDATFQQLVGMIVQSYANQLKNYNHAQQIVATDNFIAAIKSVKKAWDEVNEEDFFTKNENQLGTYRVLFLKQE